MFAFTRVSGNRKTGPIPVTMTARESCPKSCPLYRLGCYAISGPISWHWAKGCKYSLAELCQLIRSIPGGSLWRHNTAGDLPGDNESIDAQALHKIARANRGRRGFTYTHKAPIGENLVAMTEATAAGFTINLSADNAAEADTLAATGLPVVAIIPREAGKVSHTPGGRKIVQCPAENTNKITCANCGLCANASRDYVIGFKPKGRHPAAVNQLAHGEPIE